MFVGKQIYSILTACLKPDSKHVFPCPWLIAQKSFGIKIGLYVSNFHKIAIFLQDDKVVCGIILHMSSLKFLEATYVKKYYP